MQRVRVRVPATTANLGPGFDSLGLALSLYNDFTFEVDGLRPGRGRRQPSVAVATHGHETEDLPHGADNLAWTAAARGLKERGFGVDAARIGCACRIPLASGLGSSASAAVAGLVAANALCGEPLLPRERLLELAAEIEGHADNAAPALWGGMTACFDAGGRPAVVPVPLRARFGLAVVTPAMRLATSASRAALPAQYPKRDAVLNVGRVAALVAMFASGRLDELASAMADTLHQPYRAHLVPGMTQALAAALRAGAWGAALSGAGPTLIAFTPPSAQAQQGAGRAIQAVFRRHGLASTLALPRVDRKGARLLPT